MPYWNRICDLVQIDDVVFELKTSYHNDVEFTGFAYLKLMHYVRLYDNGTRLEIRTADKSIDFPLSEVKGFSSQAIWTEDGKIRNIPMGITTIRRSTGTVSFETHDLLSHLLHYLIIDKVEFGKALDLINFAFKKFMKFELDKSDSSKFDDLRILQMRGIDMN